MGLFRPKITPFSAEEEAKKGKGFRHKDKEYIHHSDLHHSETAFYRLSPNQSLIILAIILTIANSLLFNWHNTIIMIVAILTFLYFLDLLFNLYLIIRSFAYDPAIKISEKELKLAKYREWPSYTILCPLYKESAVLTQFTKAMSALDYPKNKLQILLLIEEDDIDTGNYAHSLNLPKNFELLIVPHSQPKTKPKATNYGLKYAKGEYVVIYDAEDVPDPLQLKKAVLAFEKSDRKIVCLQAKLNFYNPHQNLLTRVFTLEYSLWFDLVLTGLQSIKAPIPLGGTSNHFKTKSLIRLKGWDAFNVTEDCDLGVRLFKKGFLAVIFDSYTLEEANSGFFNWFRQRSRWIKGYIQTYFVHMRKPSEFFSNWTNPHIFSFQLIVGGKVLSMFINPFLWAITIIYFAFKPELGSFIESFFPSGIFYIAIFTLVIGNFLYFYYYMIGSVKREQWDIIEYVFLVPIYWLMMSYSAWIAFLQVLVKPHYWEKTYHGLHLMKNKKINIFN